ncbi:MAG: NBR1-Ig-like domain-containing protein, partial [Minisyncoccia bacterium]
TVDTTYCGYATPSQQVYYVSPTNNVDTTAPTCGNASNWSPPDVNGKFTLTPPADVGGSGLTSSTYSCTAAVNSTCTVPVKDNANNTTSCTSPIRIVNYTVTGSAGTNGSIAPGAQTVVSGSTAQLTVTPNTGYNASASGCAGSPTTSNGSAYTYTTGPVTANCIVTASFTLKTLTVTGSAGSNGSISPSSRTVNYGSNTTFTVTPSSGYQISSVAGCNGSLSGSTYTTGAITANCTVTASFTLASSPVNGSCATTHYSCNTGTSANNVSGANSFTWNCNGSNGGTNASCSETKVPDLTASSLVPSTAAVNVAQTYSSTISNIGTLSTGTSFPYFFQKATAANGGGTITDLTSSTMSALSAGGTATATSPSITFTTTGTYSVRVCADKTSSAGGGVIAESDEGNNCSSPWTNVTVSSSLTNNASCVSITAPASVAAGNVFSATVVMQNTGTTTWTSSYPYRLGTQSPQDTSEWAPLSSGYQNRISLPSLSVAPGSQATFSFTATAPTTLNTYAFAWKMVQEGVQWFGTTCTMNITVVAAAPDLTAAAPTPSTATV